MSRETNTFAALKGLGRFGMCMYYVSGATGISCGCGEIGRHARLRIWCREAWGFESLHPHIIPEAVTTGVGGYVPDNL